MKMLKRALSPSISDVRVSWSLPGVIQTPSKVPPVFSGDCLIIYGFLPHAKEVKGSASLNGYIGTETFGLSIDFDVKASESGRGKAVHQLAIKSLITDVDSELADKDIVKKRLGGTVKSDKDLIVKLSTSANVICSHTSFVAIDEESEEPVTGSMELRHIPIATARFFGIGDRMAFNFAASAPFSPPPGPPPGPPPPGGGYYIRTDLVGGPPPPGGVGLSLSGPPPPSPTMGSTLGGGPPSPAEESLSFDGTPPPLVLRGLSKLRGAATALPPATRKAVGFSNQTEIGSGDSRPGNAFLTIVSLQQASGAWPLDFAVARLVSKSVKDLDALSPFGKGSSTVCKSIWVTAIVLTWLEVTCASFKDEWELMANKATKWAKKQKLPKQTTWEDLMKAAQKLF